MVPPTLTSSSSATKHEWRDLIEKNHPLFSFSPVNHSFAFHQMDANAARKSALDRAGPAFIDEVSTAAMVRFKRTENIHVCVRDESPDQIGIISTQTTTMKT
jgi:hypothetical protein